MITGGLCPKSPLQIENTRDQPMHGRSMRSEGQKPSAGQKNSHPRTGLITPRFRTVPIVEGVRGWNNRTHSDAKGAKIRLRRVANVLAPWLWI